jgi:hypothetical protein
MQDLDGNPAVKVKIGGKERLLALMTYWSKSYLPDGGETPVSVSIGGTSAPVRFAHDAKTSLVKGADGVLGADGLRKFDFAIDPLYNTVEVLPHTKIGLAGAKAYFAKLPSWGGPSQIVKVPLSRTIGGAPTIKASVGGKARPFTLTLSPYNSTLGKTAAANAGKRETGWNYLSGFTVPGLSPRWLSYGYYPHWETSDYNSYGLIALDYFLSRRVLVDLADDAVYVEELSEPARVSVLLTSVTKMPLVLTGDKVMIGPIPGYFPEDAVGDLDGSRVKVIAGINVADLVREIRAGTAAATLVKLSDATDKDYDVLVVDPDGTEHEITIPHDDPPTDTRLG